MTPKEDQQPMTTREETPAPEGVAAPGHTDLMVTPESIDAFMEANPLPRPDAGGGVRGTDPYERCPTCSLSWRLFPPTKIDSVDAVRCVECKAVYPLSTPPAAVESNASVEARLREDKLAAERQYLEEIADGAWGDNPLTQSAAKERLAALSAVGDEAKKSDEAGIRVEDNPRSHGESLQQGPDTSSNPSTAAPSHGKGSDAAYVANPVASPDLLVSREAPASLDPTAERREIVARLLRNARLVTSVDRLRVEIADVEGLALAILAALDGGAGA